MQTAKRQTNEAKKCAGRPSNRDVILDAAEQLVGEQGAAHLTFDALCQATGISKGGLLYHFASKDMLLAAMLTRQVERNQQLRKQLQAQQQGQRDSYLRGVLLAALNCQEESPTLNSAMLAVAANSPELLQPLQQDLNQVFERLAQSDIGKDKALLLFFAAKGVRMFEMLGLCDASCEQREAFADALLKLVDEWQPGA
ncbi:TetR/AcrR family transcriptional regulator [Idiomarina xiamenensis]|uniref:TetR family transcriptional regulator n=1 Tax=Idiomarina xiamenensis 10-D-4 TaxID=740709 RepID=K2KF50_9GAMM|nr:TetR/AcrR family transcriptional regulator [Idiomarina xiamenensis]EKE85372.1 TetR family transcriptional regulator [Idiomarina xiamenensis 10-D-4]